MHEQHEERGRADSAVSRGQQLGQRRARGRRLGRLALGFALTGVPLVGAASACLDRPIGAPPPITTNIFVDRITQTAIDKIDLLFMIDNSISMNDKQAILRLAVPDIVNRLVNPICRDADGNQLPPPPPGEERCPDGQTREFDPINDINIAIVSSSLGDAGANDACVSGDTVDGAYLMGSNVPGTTVNRGRVPLSQPGGFLSWKPADNPNVTVDNFIQNFQNQVVAVGEQGCGWEASLESWFRFLIDPFPYAALERVVCNPGDTRADCVRPRLDAENRIVRDENVIAQRAAFLRPDSLVAIIMLTDENDCSLAPDSQNYVVAAISTTANMFRGSQACQSNPNDPCCYPCVLPAPPGCQADPTCTEQPRLSDQADGNNLRCFDQKRRFGYDFLFPTERYVNALRGRSFCWQDPGLTLSADECSGPLTANPLYEGGRDESSVFLAGIVGVPWQAIAAETDAAGNPVSANDLVFRRASEFTDDDWRQLVGSPGDAAAGVAPTPPLNPYMVETPTPRTNIAPGNPINGREYETDQQVPGTADDLQYACIFPLPETRDCADADSEGGCDCLANQLDKPLCEEVPGTSTPTTVQHFAKAYPGLRQLEVLRGYGENSIVASICAKNVEDQNRPDFGYRPAIAAIVDRLREKLGDRCLPRALLVAEDGSVPCTLVEVQLGRDQCNCDSRIRRAPADPEVASVVRDELISENICGSGDPNCNSACLCEVEQITDPTQLQQCRNDVEVPGFEGWCYVSPDEGLGAPSLVQNCAATERRLLRFAGNGLQPNTVTFVSCQGSTVTADAPASTSSL